MPLLHYQFVHSLKCGDKMPNWKSFTEISPVYYFPKLQACLLFLLAAKLLVNALLRLYPKNKSFGKWFSLLLCLIDFSLCAVLYFHYHGALNTTKIAYPYYLCFFLIFFIKLSFIIKIHLLETLIKFLFHFSLSLK